MVKKWPPLIIVRCLCHFNLVKCNWISSKIHIRIAFFKLSFKLEYGFCPTSDNHDGRQNGSHPSVSAVVVTLSHFNGISSKFHIWIASIKLSFKFEYRFFLMNDKQDGRQNGCRLSVCTCGHSTLVTYYRIASKFHIWTTFNKLLFMSEYGFCPINDNQDCRQNGYQLFIAGHYVGPYVRV